MTLPLPERVRTDARSTRVEALFQALPPEPIPYDLAWPRWEVTPALTRMLHVVKGSHELILGLEVIEETLRQRWPQGQGKAACAQFLLLSAQDGSPRFARQLAKIWETWGHLGRAAHVAADGRALGQMLFKKDKDLRALLVWGESGLVKVLLGVV